MKIKQDSIQLNTDRIDEMKAFYVDTLGARISFDCGWYVTLELGDSAAKTELSLKKPQKHDVAFSGGVVLNIKVENVDSVYDGIKDKEIDVIVPLEDHEWGDRGFGITDPIGLSLYFYHDIEPSDEFKSAFK